MILWDLTMYVIKLISKLICTQLLLTVSSAESTV